MKKIEKEILDAVRIGDLDEAQWILNHRKVKVHKQTSVRLTSPYASTIHGTTIMEHLGVEPMRVVRGSGLGTYLLADLSVPGVVTLTAERKV